MLTSIGLLLDTIGVVVLFYSGLPIRLPERNLYAEENLTEKQIKLDRKQKHIAYFGLTMLLLGFILQLISALPC